MRPQNITIGRTALIALLGIVGLLVAGVVDTVALGVCLHHGGAYLDMVPTILATGQVIVTALAAASGLGAGAHGIRHLGAAEPGSGSVMRAPTPQTTAPGSR